MREPWEPLLGNLGGIGFGAAPVCSETFTMAEDPKASAVGEKHQPRWTYQFYENQTFIFLGTRFTHTPHFCGSSGSWDTTSDHKYIENRIAKAAIAGPVRRVPKRDCLEEIKILIRLPRGNVITEHTCTAPKSTRFFMSDQKSQ